MKVTPEVLSKLAEPIPVEDVQWRVMRKSKTDPHYAECVPHIDARVVYDRLDGVLGPENWQNDVTDWPAGGAKATISIKIDGEWVSKSDVGFRTSSDKQEAEVKIKGDPSDAVKRAAVLWGIGRELYHADTVWAVVDDYGAIQGKPPLTFTGQTRFMKKDAKPSAGMKTADPLPANGKPAYDEGALLDRLAAVFPKYKRAELKTKLAKVGISPTVTTEEAVAAFMAAVEAARLASEIGGELAAPKE